MDRTEGLTWQLWDYAGKRTIPVASTLTPHQEWTSGSARFIIPQDVSIVRLDLVYRRISGSTRITGSGDFAAFALVLEKDARS